MGTFVFCPAGEGRGMRSDKRACDDGKNYDVPRDGRCINLYGGTTNAIGGVLGGLH